MECKSAKTLHQLAKNPFDLSTGLTPDRIASYQAQACGYKLLYGTEHVTEEVINGLLALAQETKAFDQMQEMQSGVKINCIEGFPSEDRAVLHTATRDFFEDPNKNPEAQKATLLAFSEIEKLQKFLHKIDQEDRFHTVVQIGIGGSDLGPQAHYEALKHFSIKGRKALFLSNIDPDQVVGILNQIDLVHTLFIVVSKTGTTLETSTNEKWVRDRLQQVGLDPKEQMVSVTMPGSPLDQAREYKACFHIWDWVGGRYSTTSMVGGVMLAWVCGFDIYWEFIRGASAMDKIALHPDLKTNLPFLAALIGIWNRNFLNHSTLALIPYSQALHRYPAHIQQLDMESNGKRINKKGETLQYETGPIIWGEPGTCAQHSFFQLLHQGTTIVPISFIGYSSSQAHDFMYNGTNSQQKLLSNLFAQAIALAIGQTSTNPNQVFPGNRPSHMLLGEKLTPYSLGALLAFFEHKVAFQGFIWGINSFDQEGVQLGKKIADRIIRLFENPNGSSFELAQAFLRQL